MIQWPISEGIRALRTRAREAAAIDFRHAQLMWAATAPHMKNRQRPPELPRILREARDGSE